jgi:hypothetical protein
MSSKFFSSREQRDNKEKVNQKNTASNTQNFKRAAGVRKSGRGK